MQGREFLQNDGCVFLPVTTLHCNVVITFSDGVENDVLSI